MNSQRLRLLLRGNEIFLRPPKILVEVGVVQPFHMMIRKENPPAPKRCKTELTFWGLEPLAIPVSTFVSRSAFWLVPGSNTAFTDAGYACPMTLITGIVESLRKGLDLVLTDSFRSVVRVT